MKSDNIRISTIKNNVCFIFNEFYINVFLLQRASTELKVQDTKSTKRGTPMKGAEPIGNRKTMTTTTSTASTRKSTDVVDGAILENGLHLRDQTAETKYDNDSATMKKSDAFVIDFDEQPPKENDGPLPRKPFSRKQSSEVSSC